MGRSRDSERRLESLDSAWNVCDTCAKTGVCGTPGRVKTPRDTGDASGCGICMKMRVRATGLQAYRAVASGGRTGCQEYVRGCPRGDDVHDNTAVRA